jgi:hypothetical protein
MKRWFKDVASDGDETTTAYMEFDGRWVVRQVWHEGIVWVASDDVRDIIVDRTGRGFSFPGLSEIPLDKARFAQDAEITEKDFEAAWNTALGFREQHPNAVTVERDHHIDPDYLERRRRGR